jgi:hypothetical protein
MVNKESIKILLNAIDNNEFSGTVEAVLYLKNKALRLVFKNSDSVEYINIPKSINIVDSFSFPEQFDLNSGLTPFLYYANGIYNKETASDGTPYVWAAPSAKIYLKHRDNNPKEIEIDFSAGFIYHMPNIKDGRVDIFINDVLMATVSVNGYQRLEPIVIDTSLNESIKQDVGYYSITLKTNYKFNPHEIDNKNVDNRDLSLILYSIKTYSKENIQEGNADG